MPVAPLARTLLTAVLIAVAPLGPAACTTTPDGPVGADPTDIGGPTDPGVESDLGGAFATRDVSGPGADSGAPPDASEGGDSGLPSAAPARADGGSGSSDGAASSDGAGPSDSPDAADPAPPADPCATRPDGPWCWLGGLLACDSGVTVVSTPCAAGCLAPAGGLPHACAPTAADGPCTGKADGGHCVAGAIVSCAGGQMLVQTECPAGCVEGPASAEDPMISCLAGPEGDALCAGLDDGLACHDDLLATCAGGVAVIVKPCSEGCVPAPPGLPDACAEAPTVAGFCTSNADGTHCDGSALILCGGGAELKKSACLDGCVSTGGGASDHCLEPLPSGVCAGAPDGDWCDGDALVTCLGGSVMSTIPCPSGCLSTPADTPDACVAGEGDFCADVPAKASPSPPTTSCAYMDWQRSPDGFYLVSQFGTSSDPTTVGHTTSCGYLQSQYGDAGCIFDKQLGECHAGPIQIPWIEGHVDWDTQAVLAAVQAVPPGGDVLVPEYFYVAGAQRFGCGALLRVSHPETGRCVVAYVEDGGPGATYEGAGFGGRRILDSSPAVVARLEVSQKGWLNSDLLYVEWGLPGDIPGHACEPCQSSPASQPNPTGVTPWRLEHMVPACGSGDGGAGCPAGDGLYCGAAVGADAGTLYDCQGGQLTLIETCEGACVANPPGTPDGCAQAAGSCPSGDGAYCGATVGADPDTLYQCAGGQLSVITACEAGCLQAPPGMPDSCAAGGPATSCPAGNGAYCGGAVGADPDTLYQCAGGQLSVIQVCSDGCQQQAAGTPDTCASPPSVGSCPSGEGAYCGGSLGLDSGTLYWCAGGEASPVEVCDQGCQTNPPGTPDACAGGGGALSLCNPFSPPQAITCGFGCYDGHYGSDYAVANGTPVYSPVGGVVVKKVDTVPGQTCSPNFGNYVKIKHGAYDVFLAHMNANILVDQGDAVSQGDPIGFVSNTGYTLAYIGGQWVCQQGGGHHLHLEVRKDGVAFDPIGSGSVSWSSGCSGGGVITPSGFCADKVNGLWCDGATLLDCQGGAAASSTPCPQGCQQMPLGTPDQCAESIGGSCPSGNGLYCGASVGLDPGTLFLCSNGSYTVAEVCANGCNVAPAGTSDACKDAPAASCPSGNGLYCGSTVGLDSNTLYSCANGSYSVSEVCSNGCNVAPAGTSDACKDAPAASCPSGNGKYCGSSVGLDSNTLYSCTNGSYSVSEVCSNGCNVAPAGTSDACNAPAPSGCPSGNGAYCGGPVGLDSSTLYSCSNGSYSFSAWCAAGCNVAPAGTSDTCKGGSCPFGNGAYCGQSVGLDSTVLYTCTNGAYTIKQSCGGTCYVAPPGQPDVCP